MSASARAKWLIVVVLAAVDAVGMRRYGFELRLSGLVPTILVLSMFSGLAVFYTYRRPEPRIVDLAHTSALLIALFAAMGAFNYITAATAVPLVEQQLAATDRMLGFDWLGWFNWVWAHPALHLVLGLAYQSFMIQVPAIIAYLAFAGRSERNSEFIWLIIVSLAIIVPASALWPASGPFVYYDVTSRADATFVPEFLAVRDGSQRVIDLVHLEGLVEFPSFHTTMAVLFVYVLRGNRMPFALAVVVNLLMLISIPSEGGHYLVDVVAGAAVAGVAIWVTPYVELLLHGLRRPSPVLAGGD